MVSFMSNVIENGNYCVYVHTSPSGKMYVGQTGKKPEYRWNNGKGYLQKKNGKYRQTAFANAIIKYGWDNIEHEIVASNLTKKEADNFEKLLIEKLKTMDSMFGYNLKEGGHQGHLSEETKKRISETLKGNVISEDVRKKISDKLKGKRMGIDNVSSKKVVQYDMQGNLIKIWDSISDASRALKIDKSNIAKCCYDYNDVWKTAGGFIWKFYGEELTKEYINLCNKRKNSKCIAQYSLSGELIYIFNNLTEAEFKTGISHGNISNCCNGKRKTAGGFIWKYYDDIKEEVI